MTTAEKIPFVDLVGQYHRYQEEFDAAMRSVVERAAFIGGAPVASFEAAYAKFCGIKHTVGVGNGTDALYLALRATGVKAGDEVITAVNTFIATSEAISMAGAKPVFVDVDDDLALMDLDQLESKITERTKVIIPVHLYGQLVDMERLMGIADKRGITVLEDAAQAHGAMLGGKRAGTFGKAACFSFYPGKNLGAYGDAGAIISDDDDLAAHLRKIANHGRADKFGHQFEGVNSRLDGLQAALLEAKLKHLDTWTKERQDAAAHYDQLFAGVDAVRCPKVRVAGGHVFHLYVLRLTEGAGSRDALRAHLNERNIQSGIHYPKPLHLLPAYAHLEQGEGSFPVAEKMATQMISLPIFPGITQAQQTRVADAVKEFLGAPQ